MSDASSVEEFLSQAKEREKVYDWLGAAEFYSKAIGLVSETDFLKLGQVQEKVGYASYRAAFQAETSESFKRHMHSAAEAYNRAAEHWEKAKKRTSGDCCKALAIWVSYWIAPSYSEKKRLLASCRASWKNIANAYKEIGDQSGYGKACNGLLQCLSHIIFIVPEGWNEAEDILNEGIHFGESAISSLSEAGEDYELAVAYICASMIYMFGGGLMYSPARKELVKKTLIYVERAVELSKRLGDAYLIAMSSFPAGWSQVVFANNLELGRKHFDETLEYGSKTRDNSLLGMACFWLAWQISWATGVEEDPDKLRHMCEEINTYADKAIAHLAITSQEEYLAMSYYMHAYAGLAEDVETDYDKRRILLEKDVETKMKGLEHGERSGAIIPIAYLFLGLSGAKYMLSSTKTNLDMKKQLLEEALGYGEKSKLLLERLMPFNYLDRGNNEGRLAFIKTGLARIETDMRAKRELLEKAVSHYEERLKLFQMYRDEMTLGPDGTRVQSAELGYFLSSFANILTELYSVTNEEKLLKKIADAYQKSAESFRKAELQSRVAEADWKIAKTYDGLGEHLKAAESFQSASESYRTAAEKIPQLKELYEDHALYMQAWSEIEKARHHHERQDYGSAEEHYGRAATLHKSLKQWSYLAPNYSAWAHLEHADDLSRKEQSEEALQIFEQAAKLFVETRKSLEAKLGGIENLDEKTMIINLTKASDARHEYCLGRMALEEAKILDKKGDHFSSSQKYGEAAQIFEKIVQTMQSEQEKKEFRLIATLSQAWQRMTRAEAEESPRLYLEASQLFEEAKDMSLNEQAKMLTSGHSRFCKALEVGTRFVETRDHSLHTAAIQHLESAATNYVKAGFRSASEYAKATEQLFDAYLNVDNAKRESDPEKKAKFYAVAEKILQSSAGSFMKAEHPEKREQVLRLLDKVKEERELATSICEVLHTPPVVSTTTTFVTPAPTHESAVGSERFEHADIQANLVTRQKELKVGESLNLEIELVNAGKRPALLTKITELIPEGFDLAEKPEIYRVEDSYIDMKGKRLDPLKMIEVKIVLRPRVQGAFPIKPRVLYIDEDGKYKSHEPESVTITVKELGIKGWIKGER